MVRVRQCFKISCIHLFLNLTSNLLVVLLTLRIFTYTKYVYVQSTKEYIMIKKLTRVHDIIQDSQRNIWGISYAV